MKDLFSSKHWLTSIATGLVANNVVEKATEKSWTKLYQDIAASNKAKVNELVKKGKSIDEAEAIVSAAQPYWKKNLGSRRINGAGVAALGLLVNYATSNETIKAGSKGMIVFGAVKALFPGLFTQNALVTFDKIFPK